MSRNFPGQGREGEKRVKRRDIPGKGNNMTKAMRQRNGSHVDGKKLSAIGAGSVTRASGERGV